MNENHENMAQQPNPIAFTPIVPIKQQNFTNIKDLVKEKLKNSKFNNPKNWPVYTKYLPKDDPRYTRL